MQRIFISDINNNPTACFNTGLDPRSFARTKMSQSLIEVGYVVNPDGTHETWKAAEVNDENGIMYIQGPLFNGSRLDLLIDRSITSKDASSQAALQAIVHWIKAKMFLGDRKSALNPGASFVCNEDGKYPKNSIFFAPENLSNRCLFLETTRPAQDLIDRYNCSYLSGLETTAFCAGVMLYTLLTGKHPYTSENANQSMRDGEFLPVNYAAPNLNERLSSYIQTALMLPVEIKEVSMSPADILSNILKILIDKDNNIVEISTLYQKLSSEKAAQIEREKKSYLFKQKYFVKTKKFVVQNKKIILGGSIVVAFVIYVIFSMAYTMYQRPSTKGMHADSVVLAYYNAFSVLDHEFMDACLYGRADRTDLDAALNLTAIIRTRKAFDSSMPNIIPAEVWKENGGELPHPFVFGITNLIIECMSGTEEEDTITFRTEYTLWPLDEGFPLNRSDKLTLKRDKSKNWRITEIVRTQQQNL